MFWENDDAISKVEQLAAHYKAEGNYVQAKSLYTCLIAMIKKSHGTENEKLALNFYRLAETYSDEGNYQAAQTYYYRASEIWRSVHPDTSESMLSHSQALQQINTLVSEEDLQNDQNEDQRAAS